MTCQKTVKKTCQKQLKKTCQKRLLSGKDYYVHTYHVSFYKVKILGQLNGSHKN